MRTTFNVLRGISLSAIAALIPAAGLAQPTAAAPKPVRTASDTYGTSVESYYRLAASEFVPIALPGHDSYSDDYYANATVVLHRYSTAPLGGFVAHPHLPGGALLTYFELDSCDYSTTHHVVAALADCDYSGSCGLSTELMFLSSANNQAPNSCSWVAADIAALGEVVNNYGRQISIFVTTEAGDNTNSFAGVILGYKLQVAPAPVAPSFGDVPTTDPGFQYIQALVASGITGGCGGGAYCPDSPVTRRQMAIFIAKALGLYLPHY